MNLLLAVDLEAEPERAVRDVGPWAERLGATVDLVYVDPYVLPADRVRDEELRERLAREADVYHARSEALLRDLLTVLPAPRRGGIRVVDGPPGEVLADLGRGYDLVCVHTHQRRGVWRLVLGSVAEKVLRRSATPVLVLPPLFGAEDA